MIDTPLVSIITPTFNRAKDYLPETIDSVLSQDYPNFEYIVIDDGSTDNTQALLASYNDPRLTWYTHENQGVIYTVNKGFQLAKGEFITVVNSDDPLLPGYISKIISYMIKNPDLLAVYPDWIMIDDQSKEICHVITYEFNYIDMISRYYCFPGPGTMLRRCVFDLVPGYNEKYPHIFDYEFYLRVGIHGDFSRYPETLATYRQHPNTITSQGKQALIDERFKMLHEFYAQKDLPLAIQKTKRQAFSNAHFIAGLNYLHKNRTKARRYFLNAIRWYPLRCARNAYPPGKSLKLIWKTILGI
ncbi:MAG: glycosyltransferase family 2 protein [Phototrophicales bacterium]